MTLRRRRAALREREDSLAHLQSTYADERTHHDELAEGWSPFFVEESRIQRNVLFFKTVLERALGPLADSLPGKSVLDCGCGHGVLSVLLARHGARVTAFDLSPGCVEACLRLAEYNGVRDRVSAHVMAFESLGLRDETFDVVVGTRVLHHVQVLPAAKNLFRILKPGGKAFFWENSDRNPVIRIMRNHARLLGVRKLGTESERLLSRDDLEVLSHVFRGQCEVHHAPFYFFTLLKKHVLRPGQGQICGLDLWLSRLFPPLRKWSMHQVLELTKEASPS
jgi:2-polyprenyl-3-methyl-5-hydroxy-6-metoxy-1,4-benzoquinol methylase